MEANGYTRSEFLCFFTTLQESLSIQKDSILEILDKDWSTTFKFVPPCRNELLRSKTAHLDG